MSTTRKKQIFNQLNFKLLKMLNFKAFKLNRFTVSLMWYPNWDY